MNSTVALDVDFDEVAFIPAEYNNTYYKDVMEDEQRLIEWQANELHDVISDHLNKRGEKHYPRHFDAGSGPSVHHLLALEKYSNELHIADYLPENLDEIKKWMRHSPLAHDWHPFVKKILDAEGVDVTDQSIKEREEAVISKIASFNPLDLKHPSEAMRKYRAPFVTSFFVADSATGNKQIFNDMTKNAFNIVEPGGMFVATYLGGCKEYKVGSKTIKSANLNRIDIEHALQESGAKDIRIWRYDTPSLTEEGFDHIFAVTAKS